jgi:hypothetical protein
MAREQSIGTCEHCQQQFEYWLFHCGFADFVYAYCDSCGMTATLSMRDKRMPNLPNCMGQQEMCAEMEAYVQPCTCGGRFRRGAAPRCPHCMKALSAELATSYIENNAPGTKKGWHWQRNWSGIYCIVIEEQKIHGNFR